ncbi:FKBP-type peptidyl-prolyl cis-trans isomerase SlyD [bacterium HR40]|nr:FKBP-type peptidyl-prolyl cis-trans isomerase SlyD [bacterium HR40]
MAARQGDRVTVHYTGRLDDGTVFDTSEGREPIAFTLGAGQVIPGFERAIEGMEEGEIRTFTVPAEEAYGPHRPELVHRIARSEVPPQVELDPGARLEARDRAGNRVLLTVVEVTDEEVVLDANHPLAGMDLTFEVEVVRID